MIVDEMEKRLRPPELVLATYPPKVITLVSGEKMVVREVKREEAGVLLETIFSLIGVPDDSYDIGGAHVLRSSGLVTLSSK